MTENIETLTPTLIFASNNNLPLQLYPSEINLLLQEFRALRDLQNKSDSKILDTCYDSSSIPASIQGIQPGHRSYMTVASSLSAYSTEGQDPGPLVQGYQRDGTRAHSFHRRALYYGANTELPNTGRIAPSPPQEPWSSFEQDLPPAGPSRIYTSPVYPIPITPSVNNGRPVSGLPIAGHAIPLQFIPPATEIDAGDPNTAAIPSSSSAVLFSRDGLQDVEPPGRSVACLGMPSQKVNTSARDGTNHAVASDSSLRARDSTLTAQSQNTNPSLASESTEEPPTPEDQAPPTCVFEFVYLDIQQEKRKRSWDPTVPKRHYKRRATNEPAGPRKTKKARRTSKEDTHVFLTKHSEAMAMAIGNKLESEH